MATTASQARQCSHPGGFGRGYVENTKTLALQTLPCLMDTGCFYGSRHHVTRWGPQPTNKLSHCSEFPALEVKRSITCAPYSASHPKRWSHSYTLEFMRSCRRLFNPSRYWFLHPQLACPRMPSSMQPLKKRAVRLLRSHFTLLF